jgi:phage tail-like protein
VDVNGTRFHLLLGGRDWLPRLDDATAPPDQGLEWDPRRVQVTLRRELFRFAPRPAEAPFTAEHRRGSARDRFGHFYWLSPDRRAIRYRPREDRKSSVFWSVDMLAGEDADPRCAAGAFVACAPPPPPSLPLLSGLAVTERHFLVVGSLQPSGLFVFDLHGGGPPVWMFWPPAVPFHPFDFAAAPGGGLWILDRPGDGTAARLWRLDRNLRVVRAGDDVTLAPPPLADAFQPVDPVPPADCVGPSRTFPSGIALGLASPPVPASGDVLSVVSLPDGTALVMDVDVAAGDTLVHRWTLTCWEGGSPAPPGAEPLGAPASLAQALEDTLGEPASLLGHDMAFVPDDTTAPGLVTGTLFVADTAGNQGFAFTVSTGLRGTAESASIETGALAAYYPMRRWAGKALIEGGDGEAYYDLADGWLPLTELARPRYAQHGMLDRIVLDGREPGCVWHRLMLDACIPPGDTIDVESRAGDDEDGLVALPWRREPPLRLRTDGPELPWTPRRGGDHAPPGVGTWELLFQAAAGQFLELRLTFRGSGRSSPKLHALRAHYPRFSYLRYLPDAYREDSASASFLDRFLANFEGFLTELEGRIAAAEVLFDHVAAPPEALDWLAGWLGAVLDEGWEESRRRLFLAHAAELYRRRGTRRGLLAAVRLAVEECPAGNLFADELEQGPFGFRLSEAFALGDPDRAHRFTVLAPVGLAASPEKRLRLREAVAAVVEQERPAHAAFDVQLYWALFRVGAARVASDTALGEGSRLAALVLGAGYLGQALLGERHPWEVRDRAVVGRDRTIRPAAGLTDEEAHDDVLRL